MDSAHTTLLGPSVNELLSAETLTPVFHVCAFQVVLNMQMLLVPAWLGLTSRASELGKPLIHPSAQSLVHTPQNLRQCLWTHLLLWTGLTWTNRGMVLSRKISMRFIGSRARMWRAPVQPSTISSILTPSCMRRAVKREDRDKGALDKATPSPTNCH